MCPIDPYFFPEWQKVLLYSVIGAHLGCAIYVTFFIDNRYNLFFLHKYKDISSALNFNLKNRHYFCYRLSR